jgi:hypothetical protein
VRAKAGVLTEHSLCSALFRLEASRGADEAQPFVNRELPQRRKVSSGRTSLLSRLDGSLVGLKAALGLPADQAVRPSGCSRSMAVAGRLGCHREARFTLVKARIGEGFAFVGRQVGLRGERFLWVLAGR